VRPAGAAPVTTAPPAPLPAVDASGAISGDEFTFNFTEPVEIQLLVEYVRRALGLQILFVDDQLRGQKVYLSQPVTIKLSQVLQFLTMLLEMKEYTLSQDEMGIFWVKPKSAVSPRKPGDQFSDTRIIRTPNIKPSTLQTSIQALITASRAGQAGPQTQPVYMDDLGIILITDSPRVTTVVQDFVDAIVQERADLKYHRFELVNISAAAAKDRVLELLGQQAQRAVGQPGVPGAAPAPGGAAAGQITNLGDRITIDPTSNALYLRGRQDEEELLANLLEVVDVPNSMKSVWYAVGNKTAQAVAVQGRAEQLGTISEQDLSDPSRPAGAAGGVAGGLQRGAGSSQDTLGSGAGFVLYPDAGGFFYRGTDAQQARVEALVKMLKSISADEIVTYEFYKLKHGKAPDVAEIIQNLLSNTAGTGNRGGLLGNNLGGNRSRTQPNQPRTPNAPAGTRTTPAGGTPEGGGGLAGGLAEIEGANVFVLADEPNNQILVKAPVKLQPQFRQLISKIDLRRPQVYIDAKIVVVSTNDNFRLAIEVQQIIGQFALNTNFGLGTLTSGSGTTATGDLNTPKSVITTLGGLTSALIRSKDVPFVVTALASNIDTRIIATPQLLVDDNEEAEISSLDQEPTTTQTQSGAAGTTLSGFGGYESAGPKLKVKPQISEGGYMRLEYTIELSSFTGAASATLPPPKLENKIDSKSVTVPTDATIVVGGLVFEQTGNTVIKVPLLGDIPLVGNLFRDTNKSGRKNILYVFITPKIMRDPTFADLRLLTKAPLASVHLESEFPPPEAETIPVVDTMAYRQGEKLKAEADKHRGETSGSPAHGTPPPHHDQAKPDEHP